MIVPPQPEPGTPAYLRYGAGLCAWIGGWLALILLDGPLDLSGLGMVLVLTASIAAVWLPIALTLAFGLAAVMAFNWLFVPPRGTFAIDLHQHAALLFVMFALSSIVAGLMAALRSQVRQARDQAQAAHALRAWSESLRDASAVQDCLPDLQHALEAFAEAPVALLALRAGLPANDAMEAVELLGSANAEQVAGLWYCLRNGQPLGPGSGRYEELANVYLPLRGRDMAYGAALLPDGFNREGARLQAQDWCDRMGAALERQHLHRQQEANLRAAAEQELRATLLAAIAHEYRTPLATIMGAASLLAQQSARLDEAHRRQMTQRIVDEATRLRQMTGNILQLARLDTAGVQLRCDWESAEELIGALAQRYEGSAARERLRLEVEADLPLLWCDSLLIAQLLDNLVDNALKYSPPAAPVCVGARRVATGVSLYVRDEGPGIPEALREAIFQPFRQGEVLPALASGPRGVGIGLALCRIIAAAHGGELRLEALGAGSCFACLLPLRAQPASPADDASMEAPA